MLRKGLRHPGVHILLLGLLVAGAILVVHGPPTGAADRRVVITGGDLLQLRAAFGEDFTEAVLVLDPGSWQGPIRSGYGLHLVKMTKPQESQIPPWTEVRAMVVRDMEYEARNATREQLYQEIAQSYQIVTDSQVAQVLESATE